MTTLTGREANGNLPDIFRPSAARTTERGYAAPMSGRSPRRWLPLLVGLAAWAAMTWPWPIRPWTIPGSPFVEADNHMWMIWRATEAIKGHPGPWANWPVGFERPLMDLVHLPLASIFMSLDPGFGYATLAALDVALALLGGWLLSREAGASREASLVGMIALGCTPFLAGAVTFGLTESWSLGWYALHGWALLRAARTESWRDALVSALALGAFALSGWYSAFFALIASPIWLGWVYTRRPTRVGWQRVLTAGTVAVMMVTPALLWFLAHGDVEGLTSRPIEPWRFRADWQHAPQLGTDPLNLITPTVQRAGLTRTAYLGLSTILLATIGARQIPWATAGTLLMVVCSLGHYATFAGQPVGFDGEPFLLPAAWITAIVPPLAAISSWYRAAGVAAVFLAPTAALGVDRILSSWTPQRGASGDALAISFAALLGADQLLMSDTPWPRLGYDPRPPVELHAIDGEGPWLVLPFDRSDGRWPAGVPRIWQRWQPFLGRAVTENYEGADASRAIALVGWLDRVCEGGANRPEMWPPAEAPPKERPSDDSDLETLRDLGLDRVVVLLPRAAEGCVLEVSHWLGAAQDNELVAWWSL